MKQKRDEKGRFEKKKEKKCKEETLDEWGWWEGVAFGAIVGTSLFILIILFAFSGGFLSTSETKTITISDKFEVSESVITCSNEVFYASDKIMYSNLKVGHAYTVKTYKPALIDHAKITEIITNNDPPAAECSG